MITTWLTAIITLLSGIGKFIDALQNYQQREAGAAEQEVKDNAAQRERENTAHDVANTVNAASDSELDKLRDKWTRPDD